MKKILFNGLLLNRQPSGVQYSIHHLIKSLSYLNNEIQFELLVSGQYDGDIQKSPNLKITNLGSKVGSRMSRIYFENVLLPAYFRAGEFDLYHAPGYTLPLYSRMPSLVTIHDLIAIDHPALCQNETALYFNLFLPPSIRKAKKIITVSHTVKSEILNHFPETDPEKIEVVYHGIDRRFKPVRDDLIIQRVKNKYQLPEKYLLFVGNIEPKKNLNRIIEALILFNREHRERYKLVIAGKRGWKYSSVFELIKKHKLEAEILLLGYVDEKDLPAIYSLAAIFVFPSLCEGFGIPVIEAMACGCPVVVSDRGALPEISGGFCPQVDPLSITGIAAAIDSIAGNEDYRLQLIEKGLRWSGQFLWDETAKQTMEIYENALKD